MAQLTVYKVSDKIADISGLQTALDSKASAADLSGLATVAYVDQQLLTISLTPGPKGDKGDPGDPASNIITSVNGKTVAVTLTAADVEADASGAAAVVQANLDTERSQRLAADQSMLLTQISQNTRIGDHEALTTDAHGGLMASYNPGASGTLNLASVYHVEYLTIQPITNFGYAIFEEGTGSSYLAGDQIRIEVYPMGWVVDGSGQYFYATDGAILDTYYAVQADGTTPYINMTCDEGSLYVGIRTTLIQGGIDILSDMHFYVGGISGVALDYPTGTDDTSSYTWGYVGMDVMFVEQPATLSFVGPEAGAIYANSWTIDASGVFSGTVSYADNTYSAYQAYKASNIDIWTNQTFNNHDLSGVYTLTATLLNATDIKMSYSTVRSISSGQCRTYMTDNHKYVIAYNDNGTMKYRYLDMTSTNATWTYTTTTPT